MMKRARAGASPIGVNLSRCSRAYLSPRQDATRVARRHAVECHPWLREGSDSLDTEILRRAQDDRRGWTVSVAPATLSCHPFASLMPSLHFSHVILSVAKD